MAKNKKYIIGAKLKTPMYSPVLREADKVKRR